MSEEKKTTARKKAGRKPKNTNAAPVERVNGADPQAAPVETAKNTPAAETGNASEHSTPETGGNNETAATDNEGGAPDNRSEESGDDPERDGGEQPAPEAGNGGATEEAPAVPEGEEGQDSEEPQAAEGWTVARVLKITKPLMKGDDVKALQTALIVRGYNCGVGGASGTYERNTAYAVRCFQSANRLIVDGKAGRFTVAALGGVWNG